MAYQTINGNNSNNTLLFVGYTGFFSEILINPYTGFTIAVSEEKNINDAIYDGLGGTDTISMSVMGDVLRLVDSSGVLMIKNIEVINAGNGGDVILLASQNFSYGNVSISGASGDDIIWSNNGNDTIRSGDGNDNVDGGAGNDLIFGGNGNDYLSGWLGMDTLYGGAGDDTFAYNADDIWAGGITLSALGSHVPFAALINLDGYNRSYDTFNGDAADDGSLGLTGTDTLIMTSGNDALILSDTLSPSNGLYYPRVAYIDVIDAGDGDDIVDLSGGASVDVTIDGGNGNDILAGSTGNDTLIGGAGNDILYGADGNDSLNGGTGSDTLYGGTGDDVYRYVLGDGSDTIIETSGQDSIAFGPGIALGNITFAKSGMDMTITIGGDVITIQNHYAADNAGRLETLTFDDGSSFDLNEAPIVEDDVIAGTEDTIITGNVLANDYDNNAGDTLTVTAATITTAYGGNVVLNADGTFTYQPAANFHGADNFSYTVTDGRGGSSTANVILNIASVNDGPVATGEQFSGHEDMPVTGNLLGNDTDIDGDTLTLNPGTITSAQGGTVTLNADGTFSYLGAANFHGNDSFDYTINDGNGGTATATVTLDIASINDNPDAVDDEFSGAEDTVITGNVLANDTDADGDTLTVHAGSFATNQGGTININADGSFSYQGAANFHGADSYTYFVNDGQGGIATASIALNVSSVNDNPVAVGEQFFGNEDDIITGNVLTNDSDADGDTLTVGAGTITSAQGGTVTLNADGTFSYQGAANFHGADSFDYTIADGQGGTATATVLLDILSFNDAPVAVNDAFSGIEDTAVTGNLLTNDSDVDGDALSILNRTVM